MLVPDNCHTTCLLRLSGVRWTRSCEQKDRSKCPAGEFSSRFPCIEGSLLLASATADSWNTSIRGRKSPRCTAAAGSHLYKQGLNHWVSPVQFPNISFHSIDPILPFCCCEVAPGSDPHRITIVWSSPRRNTGLKEARAAHTADAKSKMIHRNLPSKVFIVACNNSRNAPTSP